MSLTDVKEHNKISKPGIGTCTVLARLQTKARGLTPHKAEPAPLLGNNRCALYHVFGR